MPPPRRPPRPQGLSLGNYHIRDGRGLGIAHYIRAAWIGGFDRTILMETKITDQDYCRNRMGCNVVCSKAIIPADGYKQEGVGMTVGDLRRDVGIRRGMVALVSFV